MTSIDIGKTIEDLLLQRWPDRSMYRESWLKNFERPAFFLWLTKAESKHLNVALVEWTVELQLTIYSSIDQYDVSSTEDLRQDQADVLTLFAAPKTKVSNLDTGEERYIEIQATADGQDPDSAFVLFTARWIDSRPGPSETGQTMEHYTLRTGAAERKRNT